jgi:hypothetical protein
MESTKPMNELIVSTALLCVFHDAGETALLPVLQRWESEGKDFRVLVMGTAETVIPSEAFKDKRLTLKDFKINIIVDKTSPRTLELAAEELQRLKSIEPKIVLAGVASRIQQQVLELFSSSKTVAFVDNFDYDVSQVSFATVEKVHSAARYVLYPSKHVADLFNSRNSDALSKHNYYVCGKPTLELWEKEIAAVDRKQILQTLGFVEDKPILTLIGGYGAGYDVMNPLFEKLKANLSSRGFQVFYQPHPKVGTQKIKTTEALAVSDYIVGYNSSVIFDAAVIGKRAIFLIPKNEKTKFTHFAIEKGLIPKVENDEQLLEYMQKETTPINIREFLEMPNNSVEKISKIFEEMGF